MRIPSAHPRPARWLGAATAGLVCLLVASCGGTKPTSARGDEGSPLLVAAAADLRPAFTTIARELEASGGPRVTLTFGASGQLAQQLEDGAPYALFAAASADYVDQVLAAGVGDRRTRQVYALGRLAVWSPAQTITLAELASPEVRRIAIANPEHAPYGKAAVQILRSAGLYARVKPKLVYGDNVAAAQELAASGNAEVAIIGRSLAQSAGGAATPIAATLHRPLQQTLLVTGTGPAAAQAKAFAAFLTGPRGRAVLAADGFGLPPR